MSSNLEKHIKSCNGFVHIFLISVIVFLAAFVITGYWFYQNHWKLSDKDQKVPEVVKSTSQDDFSGWKKYTSSKYNYSFQYPTDWILSIYDENYLGTHVLTNYDPKEIEEYMNHGIVDIQKYGRSMTKIDISVSNFVFPGYYENGTYKQYVTNTNEYINAFIDAQKSQHPTDYAGIRVDKGKKIGNLDTSLLTFENNPKGIFSSVKQIVFFPANRVVTIGVYYNYLSSIQTPQIEDQTGQILSTFRFLD